MILDVLLRIEHSVNMTNEYKFLCLKFFDFSLRLTNLRIELVFWLFENMFFANLFSHRPNIHYKILYVFIKILFSEKKLYWFEKRFKKIILKSQ